MQSAKSCVPTKYAVASRILDIALAVTKMSTVEYTVARLKELLRERDVPTSGNKADLILRLQRNAPDVWNEACQAAEVHEEAQATEDDASYGDSRDGEVHLNLPQGQVREESREVQLIRRERDLLQRELELMRREAALGGRATMGEIRSPVTSEYGSHNVRMVKDLLNEFDGTSSDFGNWKREAELLRDTYSLDDNAMRVVMISKLKGKALTWFHSKPEHLRLSTIELLSEIKRMFDHRPSKLALRRDFEQRTWQVNETFSNYCYDEIILAN